MSAGEIRFLLRSSCWRARSRSRFLSSISRSSTLRRSSTISSGVGLGEISSSGWHRLTKSPTAAKRCRTTPARMDLTLTSTRGSMVPTARALSTRVPRTTGTALGPSVFLPPSFPVAAMAPRLSTTNTATNPELLARSLALALGDPAFRAHVKGELDRSPFREHKLSFQRFLAAGRGHALAAMAQRTGVATADLGRAADGAIPLEMYLPVPEHRRIWKGDANVLVATAVADHDPPVAFDVQGNRLVLDPERPPATPVIAVVDRKSVV